MKELLALLGNQGFSTEQGTFGSEREYQNKSGAHDNIDKIINDEDTYHLIREILKAPDPKAGMPTNEEIESMLKGSLNQGVPSELGRGFMPQNVPGSVRQPAPQGLQEIPQGRPGMSSFPRKPKKDINTIIQEFMKTIFK